MSGIYVGELCRLLHKLGVTQDAIAAALQVKRTAIGTWAGGRRPIPKRHLATFDGFAARVLTEARTSMHAHQPPAGEAVAALTAGDQFDIMMFTHLKQWELELYNTCGQLENEYAGYLEIIKQYGSILAPKLNRDERALLSRAYLGALRLLRTVAYREEHADESGTLQLGWPTDPDPLAYYRRLMDFARQQAGIDADEYHSDLEVL